MAPAFLLSLPAPIVRLFSNLPQGKEHYAQRINRNITGTSNPLRNKGLMIFIRYGIKNCKNKSTEEDFFI